MDNLKNISQSASDENEPLRRLGRYVELESPTGARDAIMGFTSEVASRLERLGATVTWQSHSGGDHLIASFPGSAPLESEAPILILVHSDTVWPLGQLEVMPWSVGGGVASGPGVFDMKGGIVIVEEAIGRVVEKPHRPIVVLVVADEEIGSPTSRELIEAHARIARAVLGFEPPHPDGSLKTSRWGSTRLRLEVVGREAHAALDAEAGISAIDELLDQLMIVRTVTQGTPGVLCNVGIIGGGAKTNVIPARASADIGLRFQDAETEDKILAKLLALRPLRDGAAVTVNFLSNRPAWQPGQEHDELLATIVTAGISCGQRVEGRPSTGAADTNLSGRLGVPSVDGLGPIGQGAHALSEQIVVDSLADRIVLVSAILEAL